MEGIQRERGGEGEKKGSKWWRNYVREEKNEVDNDGK